MFSEEGRRPVTAGAPLARATWVRLDRPQPQRSLWRVCLLPVPSTHLIALLRNIQEHWDDLTGHSLSAHSVKYPAQSPSSFQFGLGGSQVGGVALDALEAWAEAVYQLTSA